jgi:hypothetical protein
MGFHQRSPSQTALAPTLCEDWWLSLAEKSHSPRQRHDDPDPVSRCRLGLGIAAFAIYFGRTGFYFTSAYGT